MIGNQLKTTMLLAGLSGLLLLLGFWIGGRGGMTIALILSLVMNGIAYFFSDKIVLRMYGAKPLDKTEYGWVYDIVQELRKKMNIPMPKLWLINNPMANAFATGRNPSHASIGITSGILSILDENELRGVLAHELGHVKNRDILISTVAATLATAIGYLANIMQYAIFWQSRGGDSRQRGNPIGMLFVAILMPIAAALIRLSISRSREYLADESGANYSHDPLALASALEKLHTSIKKTHLKSNVSRAGTATLFIVYPFSGNSSWVSLFSTHPPMHKRIERLQQMAAKVF